MNKLPERVASKVFEVIRSEYKYDDNLTIIEKRVVCGRNRKSNRIEYWLSYKGATNKFFIAHADNLYEACTNITNDYKWFLGQAKKCDFTIPDWYLKKHGTALE
jgi:hypothetical protein